MAKSKQFMARVKETLEKAEDVLAGKNCNCDDGNIEYVDEDVESIVKQVQPQPVQGGNTYKFVFESGSIHVDAINIVASESLLGGNASSPFAQLFGGRQFSAGLPTPVAPISAPASKPEEKPAPKKSVPPVSQPAPAEEDGAEFVFYDKPKVSDEDELPDEIFFDAVRSKPKPTEPKIRYGVAVKDSDGEYFLEKPNLGLLPRLGAKGVVRLAIQAIGGNGKKKTIVLSKEGIQDAEPDVQKEVAEVMNLCKKLNITLTYPE